MQLELQVFYRILTILPITEMLVKSQCVPVKAPVGRAKRSLYAEVLWSVEA